MNEKGSNYHLKGFAYDIMFKTQIIMKKGGEEKMENTIIIVLNALGALGEKGVHYVLGLIETKIVASSTLIDNSIFYKVVNAIKSYKFQNPIE